MLFEPSLSNQHTIPTNTVMNIETNYMNRVLFASLITAACEGSDNHMSYDDMSAIYECLRDKCDERRETNYGDGRTMIVDASVGMNNHFGQFYTDHHITVMKFHGAECKLRATILINPQLLGQPVSVGFVKCEPGMQGRYGRTAYIAQYENYDVYAESDECPF